MRFDRHRIRSLLLEAAVLLLAVAAGTGLAAAASGSPPPTRAPRPFTISGAVDGVFPGRTSQLRLTVRNTTERKRLRVVSLTVAVGDAAPGCDAGQLTIGPFSGSIKLRRRQAKTVTLPATLARNAPDACQGASFPLTFGGRAVKFR